MLQDGEPGGLPLYEHLVLQDAVVIPGILVGFLHTQAGFTVMGAVGHHLVPGLGIQFQEFGGIQQAGVAVCLAAFAQDKRRIRGQDGLYLLLQFLLQEALIMDEVRVQGIVVIGQAVRHHLHLPKFRRQTAQGLDEARIPVHLHIQAEHDAVIGRAVLVEVVVFPGHLLQGIADVKGVILLLGIQHQGQVVAQLDNLHHLLVLQGILAFHRFPRFVNLHIVVIQLPAQVGKRSVQTQSREHRQGRHSHYKQCRQDAEEFTFFHISILIPS